METTTKIRTLIRSISDLEGLPAATLRATYLSEKSLGSADVVVAVLRVLATLEQEVRDGIEPGPIDELPGLLETALAGLEQEGLDLWAVVREPGVHHLAMHFEWGMTRFSDSTIVTIAFVIRNRAGEYLELFSRDAEDLIACSDCFRRLNRDVTPDYLFDHYGTDADQDVSSFRLSGRPSAYLLQNRGLHPSSPWLPAGAGLVRCRACKRTFDLKSGKEEVL